MGIPESFMTYFLWIDSLKDYWRQSELQTEFIMIALELLYSAKHDNYSYIE